jgi:hypothetical protein
MRTQVLVTLGFHGLRRDQEGRTRHRQQLRDAATRADQDSRVVRAFEQHILGFLGTAAAQTAPSNTKMLSDIR